MKNRVRVIITYGPDNDLTDKEYTLEIVGLCGSLDIFSHGGVDCISLIQEAVYEWMEPENLPKEAVIELDLLESGEWEDVFWHKYYVVETKKVTDLQAH